MLCELGWALFVISPFIWRFIFNWYDEKHKDDRTSFIERG